MKDIINSLTVMTSLCQLKWGNLDPEVWQEIQKAKLAIDKLTEIDQVTSELLGCYLSNIERRGEPIPETFIDPFSNKVMDNATPIPIKILNKLKNKLAP